MKRNAIEPLYALSPSQRRALNQQGPKGDKARKHLAVAEAMAAGATRAEAAESSGLSRSITNRLGAAMKIPRAPRKPAKSHGMEPTREGYDALTPNQRAHIPDTKYVQSLLAAGYKARRTRDAYRLVDDDSDGPYWHLHVEITPYRRSEYRRSVNNRRACTRVRTVWRIGLLDRVAETLDAAVRTIDAHLGRQSQIKPLRHTPRILALAREMGADLDVPEQRHAVYRVARRRRNMSIKNWLS